MYIPSPRPLKYTAFPEYNGPRDTERVFKTVNGQDRLIKAKDLKAFFDVTEDGRVYGRAGVSQELFPSNMTHKLWHGEGLTGGIRERFKHVNQNQSGDYFYGRFLGVLFYRGVIVFAHHYGFFPELVRYRDEEGRNTCLSNIYPSTREQLGRETWSKSKKKRGRPRTNFK